MPGLHEVGSTVPVEQKAPDGHASQSSSLVMDRLSAAIVAFWKRPDGQGSALDAPSAQYEAGEHATHADWPLSIWKRPAGHGSQEPRPTSGCTVPGVHAVGSSDPVEQNEPVGHARQSSSLVMDRLSAAIVLFS